MVFLNALLSFLVAIAILVTVHEFGHFYVAKKIGIKVLRFSIGFGKILKSWQWGETKYTICAVPLGGFVKMLDENDGKVKKEERHRAFNHQNVYKRIAVVIAGPAANFILAIIIYTFIFMVGTTSLKPIVGFVEKNSIAKQTGFKIGDELLSINNNKTPTINEFAINFIQSIDNKSTQIQVLTKNNDIKDYLLPPISDFLKNPEQGVEKYLGFKFALPQIPAVIEKVLPSSPAKIAGILPFDKILTANNKKINSWTDFVRIIKNNANKKINLKIERNKEIIYLNTVPKNENGTPKIGVSVFMPKNYMDKWLVVVKKDFASAFINANQKVYQLTKLNLTMIKKMIVGEVSLNQLSGPVTIANYAGKSAKVGIMSFLSFLALISIGLGFLNLLPIPLLDGGHLFFYFIEIIKGSKVSKTFEQNLIKLGLFIIVSLTIIALYNDVFRLF